MLVCCSPSEKSDMLSIVSRSEWGSVPAEHDSLLAAVQKRIKKDSTTLNK